MAKTDSLDTVTKWIIGLLIIGFMLIIFLVIVGNLSGNLGFATDSTGDNNTESVINNFTAGVLTFAGFFNTLFTAAAIFAVLAIFIALLMLVVSIRKKVKGEGGDNSDFG